MIVVFVDTNLFLQCKDLKHLPWKDIFKDDKILIKVPSAVLDEIDRHKQDGNSRRSKRARKASSYFRTVILNDESRIIIRKTDPHVELSFTSHSVPQSESQYNLDLSRPDNQIIEEALNYAASNQHEKVELLTHDTIPILTAKRCGLEVSIIPDEWLLDPEPDSRDKRIFELEKKLKKLEKTHPKIEIISQYQSSEPTESLIISVTTYDDLPEHKINALVSQAQERHPLITHFNAPKSTKKLGYHPAHLMLGIKEHYQPPSEEKIREYTEEKYPEWLDCMRSYFEKLQINLELLERHSKVSFRIFNSGTVPAENTIIEFQAVGGLFFMPIKSDDDQGEEKKENEIPTPPSPPKGKWVQRGGVLDMMNSFQKLKALSSFGHTRPYSNFSLPTMAKQRDRNAFYWKDGKPVGPETIWTYECKEFMHQVDPEIFSLNLIVSPKENITKAAVKCLVTASNLPNPVRKTLPVQIEYKKGNIEDIANGLLAKFLPQFNFIKLRKE